MKEKSKAILAKRREQLEAIGRLVPGLAATLGAAAEVVLHDLSDPEHSIKAIAGDITHRTLGGPLTDLVLRLLRARTTNQDVVNYENVTKDGRKLRSSTIFISDGDEVIGCLCINIDLTGPLLAQKFLQDYCTAAKLSTGEKDCPESFSADVYEMLSRLMDEIVAKIGVPVAKMTRQDRLVAVKTLDEKGFFMIKGTIDYAASALLVSRYTVYNYLTQTRMAAYPERNLREDS